MNRGRLAYIVLGGYGGRPLDEAFDRWREEADSSGNFARLWSRFTSAIADIADALLHMANAGSVHGDVSPSNILVRSDPNAAQAQLIDFETASSESTTTTAHSGESSLNKGFRHPSSTLLRGTEGYLSPEALRGESTSLESDLYALGACVWHTLLSMRKGLSMQKALSMSQGSALDWQLQSPHELDAQQRYEALRSATHNTDAPVRFIELVSAWLAVDKSERTSDRRKIDEALNSQSPVVDGSPQIRSGRLPQLSSLPTSLERELVAFSHSAAGSRIGALACGDGSDVREVLDRLEERARISSLGYVETSFGKRRRQTQCGVLAAARQIASRAGSTQIETPTSPDQVAEILRTVSSRTPLVLVLRHSELAQRESLDIIQRVQSGPPPTNLLAIFVLEDCKSRIPQHVLRFLGHEDVAEFSTPRLSLDQTLRRLRLRGIHRTWTREDAAVVLAETQGGSRATDVFVQTHTDFDLASFKSDSPTTFARLLEQAFANADAEDRRALEALSVLEEREVPFALAVEILKLTIPTDQQACLRRLCRTGFLEVRCVDGSSFLRWSEVRFAEQTLRSLDHERRIYLHGLLDVSSKIGSGDKCSPTKRSSPNAMSEFQTAADDGTLEVHRRCAESKLLDASVLRSQGDRTGAARNVESAIDLWLRLDDRDSAVQSMIEAAEIEQERGNFRRALEHCSSAARICKKSLDGVPVASVFARIAHIRHEQGELDLAERYAKKAIDLFATLGDVASVERTSMIIAKTALDRGRVAECFERCRDGKRFFSSEDCRDLLRIDALHAEAMAATGQRARTRRLFESILVRAKSLKDSSSQITALLFLSRISIEDRSFRSARNAVEEALRISRQQGLHRRRVESLIDACGLETLLGNFERATARLEEAYSLLERFAFRDLSPRYFYWCGRLSAESNSAFSTSSETRSENDADRYLQRALIEAEHWGLTDLLWRIHAHAGYVARRAELHDDARSHWKSAQAVLEAIRSELPRKLDREEFYAPIERAEVLRGLAESASSGSQLAKTQALQRKPDRQLDDAFRRALIEQKLDRHLLDLHKCADRVGDDLRLDVVLERVIDASLEVVPAERAFLILLDSEGQRSVRIARSLDGESIASADDKVSSSIQDLVIESGEPHRDGNASAAGALPSSRSIRDLRIRSVLCLPLSHRGSVFGTLYLDHRHCRDAFDFDDLDRATQIASHAAIAISNARRAVEDRQEKERLEEEKQNAVISNLKLRQAAHKNAVRLAIEHAKRESSKSNELIGDGKLIQRARERIQSAANSKLPVLILGESGTGKELAARRIHELSGRKGRFVSENCGAFPAGLFESQLFGHTKGAFTGASHASSGLLHQAHGGTLFLDGLNELDPDLQRKLLRVLEEEKVRPLGGEDYKPVDLRVITSSSVDLEKLADQGEFQKELFYRLGVFTIHLPALREHREDIPALAQHFLEQIAARDGGENKRFSSDALKALMQRRWPGNVRELRNSIERLRLLCADNHEISFADLQRELSDEVLSTPQTPVASFRESREDFERRYLLDLLSRHGNSVRHAADHAELSRESFYRLMRKHGITPK